MTTDPVVHVIDDDHAARDALTFLLKADGLPVRAHESAEVFLDSLVAMEAGCIITDVRMPKISGLDLLRHLKTRGISWPVIVITGQADVPVAIEAIKSGAVDFIEKPYDAEVLLASVKAALDGQTSETRDAHRLECRQKLATLSAHERQVLEALIDGQSNQSIASGLGMQAHSVDMHRANLLTKMGATSLSDLVRMMLLGAT